MATSPPLPLQSLSTLPLPLLHFLLLLLTSTLLPQSTSQTLTPQQQLQQQLQLQQQQERQTLLQLKSDWGNHPSLSTWNSTSTDHCNWDGLTCTDDYVVAGISLPLRNLTRPIPSSICDLKNLSHIDLYYNNLPGEFPTVLYKCSSLEYLELAENRFVGELPADIHLLSPKLAYLSLYANNFSGDVPPSVGRLPALQSLLLHYNLLNGSYPAEIGNLSDLQDLSLAYNPFAPAQIPPEFGNLTKLKSLWITNVGAVGQIPDTFAKLTEVEYFDLGWNSMNGTIPDWIWTLPKLTNLYLYANQFSGGINRTISAPSLVEIDVSMNQLTGPMPADLGKLTNLTVLFMYYNRLSGEIPASLANCYMLNNVQLYKNNFSGAFPTTIWSAFNLTIVKLSNNAFSGTLPDQLPQSLTWLDIQNNRFYGSIPLLPCSLMIFKASNNSLSGKIPNKFARNSQLEIMLLGKNQISGTIPPEISALEFLTELNLSNNQLTGEIPPSISWLPSLAILDLSKNQLSGSIPQQLGNTHSFLNLSDNQLSGEIPMSLQNHAYERSFLSNPGLCSSLNFVVDLRRCKDTSDGSHKLSRRLVILFVLLGGFALLSIAAFSIHKVRKYRRREKITNSELGASMLTTFYAIDFTEQEIMSGLTEDNMIGRGGSGKVYLISLRNRAEEIVAVKKIWNSKKFDAQLEKEFQAEVEILGSVRHANIVKLLCCISSSNSKLLVYEYMENESLHRWLHGRERMAGGSSPLDWPMRLNIAVGAARGLCYMHHDCSPPIVHRDVKSSNILLDSEFRAKIADFGLARMLVKNGEPESVSAIAGSFGYMAPEYANLRKINEKVDVYSFGMVLLELTTGRRANDMGEHGGLAKWAWQHFQEDGGLIYVIDEVIRDPAYLYTVEVMLKLGLMCTGLSPSSRPSMKEVLQVLTWCNRRHGTSDTANDEMEIA